MSEMDSAEDTKVRILNPPNFLKNKTPMAPGLLEDMLARADKLVAGLQDEFAASTELRLRRLAEIFKSQWSLSATRGEAVLEFRRIAHDIKGEAGTFGYPLITEIADLFGDYLRETQPATQKPEIVQSYLAAFQLVWSNRMSGEGGTGGRELIASLMKLNEKTLGGS